METLLDTYHRQPREGEARLDWDDRTCQKLDEVRAPLPMKAGRQFRQESEYNRMERRNIFLGNDMARCIRYFKVTERRIKAYYVHFVAELLGALYHEIKK